jgi:hypothetical protein
MSAFGGKADIDRETVRPRWREPLASRSGYTAKRVGALISTTTYEDEEVGFASNLFERVKHKDAIEYHRTTAINRRANARPRACLCKPARAAV